MANILAFSGSSRQGSFNRALLEVAVQGARDAGGTVTVVDLAALNLPVYDGDLEEREGLPAAAREFKQQLLDSDGLLIASPEYNSCITPLLKNAIDWASRKESEEEPMVAAFVGKKAALLAASPGGYGGKRSLDFLRQILGNIQVEVLPTEVTLPKAHEQVDDQGQLQDAGTARAAADLGAALVRACS